MASSGKKGKTKWKPVNSAQIINATTRKIASSSWADDSNETDDAIDFGRKAEVSLPTAPRAARGPENDANIPHEPPFEAYLSNLSYEVTEEDLADFFAHLKVKNVRLPRDDRGNTMKAKGFGYVEFEDRNNLVEALSVADTNLKNRRMRIEVADEGRDRGRGGQRDRGPNEPDRTSGDWRSGPRSDSDSGDSYRSGPRREYGMDRGGMYGDRRGGSFRDDDRDRGGFTRDGDRPFRDNRGFKDDRGGGGMYRDMGGGDRYERRSYEDRRNFDDRRDYKGSNDRRDFGGGGDRRDFNDGGGDRRDYNSGDRRSGGPDGRDFGGGDRRDGGGDRAWRTPLSQSRIENGLDRGEPKTRTKLNLQPRTRPVNGYVLPGTPATNLSPATAASIFGGARPVDTSAREREIEERLAKQRDDHLPPTTREEIKTSAKGSQPQKEDAPAPQTIEPAPPPKENIWSRRSQVKETKEPVSTGPFNEEDY